MNRLFLLALALAVLSARATRAEGGPVAEACARGAFTQDVEGAFRLSEERDLPLLLAFRGPGWCEWCRLADRRVFSQEAWTSWAATNLVLAAVDYPKDPASQTEEVRARNAEMARRFGYDVLPSYVLLAPGAAGAEELARLPGDRVLTPEGFIGEIRAALRILDPAFLAERLSPEEKARFEDLRAQRRERFAAAEARFAALREASESWAARIAEARAADPDRARALETEATSALVELAIPTVRTDDGAFPDVEYERLLEKLR